MILGKSFSISFHINQDDPFLHDIEYGNLEIVQKNKTTRNTNENVF